jgi:hypothetical protein
MPKHGSSAANMMQESNPLFHKVDAPPTEEAIVLQSTKKVWGQKPEPEEEKK